MKRFNPERELRKIQHGGRNKTIAFVILLLVVSVVSYSFALYQVRYSKRIIYTKVAPFSSKDIELAVNIKGEGSSNKFPTKEEATEKGIKFTGLECDKDGITTATWDKSKWGLNLFTSEPNKCTVNFGKTHTVKVEVTSHGSVSPETQEVNTNSDSETITITPDEGYGVSSIMCTNNQQVEQTWHAFKVTNVTSDTKCTVTLAPTEVKQFNEVIVKDDETIFDDDPGGNLRYAGASDKVNNYIWFNCDDYSKEMDEINCEKWRIIGLFKNVTKAAGETEDLVKIIRADKIGDIPWDSSGRNNWTRPATLQKGLNGPYLNNEDNGEWITQEEYTSSSYPNTKDESYKSITSSTKGMIEQVTWNLGGTPNYNTSKASDFYTAERESTVPYGASATWDGYIGLMYPSDYGYATGGGSKYNRQQCLDYVLYNWKDTGYKDDCAGNGWLWTSGASQWTLTPVSSSSGTVYSVDTSRNITGGYGATSRFWVRPSLYLTSSIRIKIWNGGGTVEEPYILIP